MVKLHTWQYRYNVKTGSANACCCIYCINCTAVDGFKKCTKVTTVAKKICAEMLLQWHCLVCSRAIDCFSNFRHNLLNIERDVNSSTFTKKPTVTHSSGLCLHAATFNKISTTVQVSLYTQLHVTNSRPQFRSLSKHSFM